MLSFLVDVLPYKPECYIPAVIYRLNQDFLNTYFSRFWYFKKLSLQWLPVRLNLLPYIVTELDLADVYIYVI